LQKGNSTLEIGIKITTVVDALFFKMAPQTMAVDAFWYRGMVFLEENHVVILTTLYHFARSIAAAEQTSSHQKKNLSVRSSNVQVSSPLFYL
jgi:hypothetical protein